MDTGATNRVRQTLSVIPINEINSVILDGPLDLSDLFRVRPTKNVARIAFRTCLSRHNFKS
jgi:hypothetical protein